MTFILKWLNTSFLQLVNDDSAFKGEAITYVRIITGASANPFIIGTSIGFELDKKFCLK